MHMYTYSKHAIPLGSPQDSISDERDEFQLLVLDVLCCEVVPELKTTHHEGVDNNFRTLLNKSVHLLKYNLNWLTTLSAKQRFCWGILATCCSKISISTQNFNWVHLYTSIFSNDMKLGVVFCTYCTGKSLPTDQCNMAIQLPDDIRRHPLEDLCRYYSCRSVAHI